MPEQATVKPTLGLTGVTMNAMALIAPGAFLWITFQLQAAATAPDGSSVAVRKAMMSARPASEAPTTSPRRPSSTARTRRITASPGSPSW